MDNKQLRAFKTETTFSSHNIKCALCEIVDITKEYEEGGVSRRMFHAVLLDSRDKLQRQLDGLNETLINNDIK